MTGCEKVLALLADGDWHSHNEGYALNVMLHSRVADLRKRGYGIECDKTGRDYRYRLTSRPPAQDTDTSSGSVEPLEPGSALAPPSVSCADGQLTLAGVA